MGCTSARAPLPVVNTSPSAETEETTPEIKEFRETYAVVRGDTLIAIADRFGIHLNDLVRENNIADPTMIYVGQVLLCQESSGNLPHKNHHKQQVTDLHPDPVRLNGLGGYVA